MPHRSDMVLQALNQCVRETRPGGRIDAVEQLSETLALYTGVRLEWQDSNLQSFASTGRGPGHLSTSHEEAGLTGIPLLYSICRIFQQIVAL